MERGGGPAYGGVAPVRLAVRAGSVAAPGCPLPGLLATPLVVTDDGGGLAQHVVAGLVEGGVAATAVAQVPRDARGVLFLGGLRDVCTVEEALAVNREAVRAAQAVAVSCQSDGGIFVTVQDTGGDFGLAGATQPRAWLGGVAGLAHTAAREWPLASVKAIDCERGGRDRRTVAAALVRELLTGGSTLDVGLTACGERLTIEPAPLPRVPGAPSRGDQVIVVSEGDPAMTAAAVAALTPDHRVVLVGAATGWADPRVRYLTGDWRRPTALPRALAKVRREWGPVTGVVHVPGPSGCHFLADQAEREYLQAFLAKVDMLRMLLAATAHDPLEFLLVFSSAGAETGGGPDAMADAVLHQVAAAEARRHPDRLTRAIGWGRWRGGKIGPALAEHLRRQDIPLLSVDAGAEAIRAELGTGGGARVLVSAGAVTVSADHRIMDVEAGDGATLALAIEWLVRAIDMERGPADVVVLRDIVSVVGQDTLVDKDFQVRGRLACGSDGPRLDLELRAHDGTPLYRANAELRPGTDETSLPKDGEVAAVVAGGLHMSIEWARQVFDGMARPVAVAEFRLPRAGAAPGPFVVHRRHVAETYAECDVECLGEDGLPCAELRGIRLVP